MKEKDDIAMFFVCVVLELWSILKELIFIECYYLLSFLSYITASEDVFKGLLTSLPKPGGGEYGKFYSLTALNDPRIGMTQNLNPDSFSIK